MPVEKPRLYYIDNLRVLACFLVVLMHSPIPSENANGPFLTALSYFTAPCIGLFFMVSGSLLLPVKTDSFAFLKRRLTKVVVPLLVWTAVYVALKLYFSESEINLIQSVLSVPFSAQGNGVLWFMYTLIGLYLLAPILSAWLEKASDRELRFVLLLWGVTLCYPLLNSWLTITTGTTGVLYYFCGYAGYFLLGYSLKNGRIKIPFIIPLIIVAVGIVLLLYLKKMNIDFDFYSLFWYESIFIGALCCVYWQITSYQATRANHSTLLTSITTQISNLSFGIYLVHILIMRYWLWNISFITSIPIYMVQSLVVTALTFTISLCVCILFSRLRIGQWIIGYQFKNK